MEWFVAMLWGMFGSATLELMDFSSLIRQRISAKSNKDIPNPKIIEYPLAYLLATVCRVLSGGGVASIMALSGGQVTTAFGAACAGIAAPAIIERLTKLGST